MGGIKLQAPYSRRILAYCENNGVSVPPGFHVRNAEKFAVINVSSVPPSLVAVTSYLESDIIKFLSHPRNTNLSFRVLDFKSGHELECIGGKHLARSSPFQHELPNEVKYRVEP
jgi:hypothetical protein